LIDRKRVSVDFLQLVVSGEIEQAYRKYADVNGKHHNPFYAAGFPALQKGMIENHLQFPDKKITVKHVIGEGDLVSVHSHVILRAGDNEFATTHWFRFQGDKMVEMWDCGQPVPADSPNKDGMF